jgi:DNA invertase Pin-like site-specific DNA recombinase
MRNTEGMRTQSAQRRRRLRRWVAGPALGLVSSLALVTAAAGQGGSSSSSGGDGDPAAALLLGGAALLLFAAALVGYAVTRWRRRRGALEAASEPVSLAAGDDSARIARENGLTQMLRRVTETGDTRSERVATPTQTARTRALGYTTFPERKRAVSPEGRYQARRISAACEARGMVLHQLVGDVHSYSGPDLERPGLTHALEMLANGEASCLVVAGLDRLSTSAANLGTVIEWLDDIGARLVVIDIDLDTDSDEGRLAARALTRIGALERRSGTAPTPRPAPRERVGGTRGRPAVADLPLLQRRIATMRASGMTLQAIADTLNREGVPTLRGGSKWRPSSVQAATGYKRPGRHATEPAGAERERDG